MKKIYSLLICLVSLTTFGQIFSDDFNYTDSSLLTANGWNGFSAAGTNAVDVGVSNGLVYAGYSGTSGFTAAVEGNAALLDNTGEDVNKTFAAPVTSGNLYFSFLVNVTSDAASAGYFTGFNTTGTTFGNRIFYRPSATAGKVNFGISNTSTAVYGTTDFDLNTTYLIIVKYDVSTTGSSTMWVKSSGVPTTEVAAGTPEVTNTGSGSATISGVFLRQFNASQSIILDGMRIYSTWFNTTACPLALDTETAVCDAVTTSIDTYTATVPFTGGGTLSYTLSSDSGTISGDNPSTTAAGNIIISGIAEGTNVTLTVTGGCGLNKIITAPECKPINTLPFYDTFDYTVGNSLGLEQKWTNVNSGDDILVSTGNLTYSGLNTTGNSVTFDGTGIDTFSPITSTDSGTLYYSFLLNVSDMTAATNTSGGYLAGFGESTTALGATLWTTKVDDTNYNLGVEVRTAAGTTTTYTTTPYTTGSTVFVVVKYTFNTVDGADDTVSLYVNPVVNSPEPGAATVTDTHTGTDLPSIGYFFLRQDSVTETPPVQIDELRIGTTWSDVVPQSAGLENNAINGLAMYPNPVSGTVLNITSDLNSDMNVAIFDMLGKEVVNANVVNNTVTIGELNAGIYIVKITEDGKTATRKLVVK